MKYIANEAECTIILDSKHNIPGIEDALRGIACTIMGVDRSGM